MAGDGEDAQGEAANSKDDAPNNGSRNWSDIVLALIPAEVTAVYLGIRSTVAMIGESGEDIGAYVPYALAISIIVLASVTPLYASRIRGASLRTGSFMALSFLIWAANIDYDRVLEIIDTTGSPLLLASASYVIPISIIVWGGLAVPMFAQSVSRMNSPQLPADEGAAA